MKKADLLKECYERGINVPEGKITNKELEFMLGENYYLQHPEVQTWGMKKRLYELSSPQLCFSFKDLKDSQKETVLNSLNWMGDVKIDGCRLLVFYHPDYGFEFFSRDISELTFLPNEYTDKILIIKDGVVRTPQSFKGEFNVSFILDGEVVLSEPVHDSRESVSAFGTFNLTELNGTVSILGSLPERAKNIQMEGNKLKFYTFDLLELNEVDFKSKPLRVRLSKLDSLLRSISHIVPFERPESTVTNKQEFFDRVVGLGGEGIVLKNLEAPYHATTSRLRDVQVKMKRTLSGVANADIDCFISGVVPPKKDSIHDIRGLIGGVKVSVFITESNGEQVEKWIGTVSGIPDTWREALTEHDVEGDLILNPKYYGKVVTCDGQDFSSKNLRMSHCRITNWDRTDKTMSDCVQDFNFIESQVL